MYTLPIESPQRKNFNTLVKAAKNDQLCLLSAYDSSTDLPVTLLCAVNIVGGIEASNELVPLAVQCQDNPYERYRPPMHGPGDVSDDNSCVH